MQTSYPFLTEIFALQGDTTRPTQERIFIPVHAMNSASMPLMQITWARSGLPCSLLLAA